MTRCQECCKRELNLSRAEGELSRSKGLLQRNGNRYGGRYIEQVKAAKRNLEIAQEVLGDHIDRDHDGVQPPEAAVVDRLRAPVKKAAPIPDGKAKCSACNRVASIVGGTRLRRHRTKRGDQCPNVQLGEGRVLTGPAPEVKIPHLSDRRPGGHVRRDESEPSRLDVGSTCRECGKWLPGERILCGRCFATQGRAS